MTLNQICFLAFSAVIGISGCSGDSESFRVKGSSSATGASENSQIILRPYNSEDVAGSPTSFNVRVFKSYLSENADCSNAVLIDDKGDSGQVYDFYTSPTIFSASPTAGTYNCLILVIHDTMTFKADQTAVDAHEGCTDTTTENTFDVYRDGEEDDGDWIDADGNAVDATGSAASPGSDRIAIFLTTGNISDIRVGGATPHAHQAGTLTGQLVVPGSVTYYWDASNQVANQDFGGSDYCWIGDVVTGFR